MTTIQHNQRIAGQAREAGSLRTDDFTPTPPEALRPLLRLEKFKGVIWEPACGEGHICKVLLEEGYKVEASDLVDRGYGQPRVDFLMERAGRGPNIITNPPFKLATEFCLKALELTTGKVAMFLPLNYQAGGDNCGRRDLWRNTPIARFYVFSDRVQMKRNGWDGGKGGGMINFMWAVWEHGHKGPPQTFWIDSDPTP